MESPSLSDKVGFLESVTDILGRNPVDFADKAHFIQSTRGTQNEYSAAGVLLLLYFKPDRLSSSQREGEFTFQLIKRSSTVTQPGDLSCPGGLLHRFFDPLLRPVIMFNLLPIMQGKARQYARMRDKETFNTITLFLTNAVRETWEETGLSPFNITFAGPLPSYTLHFFRRTIFPLVCHVKKEWPFRPNDEVDRIVEIPLSAFFNASSYGTFIIEMPDEYRTMREGPLEFPCLLFPDRTGDEEILWGATFSIIMNFLQVVFGLRLPDLLSKRTIRKTLSPAYLTGHIKRS